MPAFKGSPIHPTHRCGQEWGRIPTRPYLLPVHFSTNITTVNCLNECRLFVEICKRGRGKHKGFWGIEMNDGRRVYRSLYWTIDAADHLLKNAKIYFRTLKYWHAPMNHAFALCIVIVYGFYQECCEGMIEE